MQMSKSQTTNALKSATSQKSKKNIVLISKATAKDRLIYKVPECAENYFHALCDPFNVPTGVCIPCDLFPIPSQKIKSWIRGTFQLGTSGIGFFRLNPTAWNDQVCTNYSTSASVGSASTLFMSFTNTAGSLMSQLPYAAPVSVPPTISARICAVGLRIKYIGTAMNSNGLCASYEDPDNLDVGPLSWNTLNSAPYVSIARVANSNSWDKAVCFSGPTTPSQLEFLSTSFPLGGPSSWICAVSGIAGDLYEFEVCQHTEFIGRGVVGRTMSHAEPLEFGKILETVKSATIDRPLEPPMTKSLWDRLKDNLAESLPRFASGGAAVVESVLKLSPSKLYEGYKGIENGFKQLYGEYPQQGFKALEAPKPPHFVLDQARVVYPSYVEVVDTVDNLPGKVEDEAKKLREYLLYKNSAGSRS